MFQIVPVLMTKPIRTKTTAMMLKMTGEKGTIRMASTIHTIFRFQISSKKAGVTSSQRRFFYSFTMQVMAAWIINNIMSSMKTQMIRDSGQRKKCKD